MQQRLDRGESRTLWRTLELWDLAGLRRGAHDLLKALVLISCEKDLTNTISTDDIIKNLEKDSTVYCKLFANAKCWKVISISKAYQFIKPLQNFPLDSQVNAHT